MDGRLPASFGSWRNLGTDRAYAAISGGLAGLDGFGRGVGAIFVVDGDAPIDTSMRFAPIGDSNRCPTAPSSFVR